MFRASASGRVVAGGVGTGVGTGAGTGAGGAGTAGTAGTASDGDGDDDDAEVVANISNDSKITCKIDIGAIRFTVAAPRAADVESSSRAASRGGRRIVRSAERRVD